MVNAEETEQVLSEENRSAPTTGHQNDAGSFKGQFF